VKKGYDLLGCTLPVLNKTNWRPVDRPGASWFCDCKKRIYQFQLIRSNHGNFKRFLSSNKYNKFLGWRSRELERQPE
jgi:hypothetical protein